MWRTMFSISTMASSTRMPVTSVIASRLMKLNENPISHIAPKAGMMESGRAMAASTVARQSRRNRNTTRVASAAPSSSDSIAELKLPWAERTLSSICA